MLFVLVRCVVFVVFVLVLMIMIVSAMVFVVVLLYDFGVIVIDGIGCCFGIDFMVLIG